MDDAGSKFEIPDPVWKFKKRKILSSDSPLMLMDVKTEAGDCLLIIEFKDLYT
jgi:hypothetical protein